MAFRWVESFGADESYIKCLVPDVTYNSFNDMLNDFKTNGIIVDDLPNKEKTDLTSSFAPSGTFTLANGNSYFNRASKLAGATQWWDFQAFNVGTELAIASSGGYSPNGRFITIGIDEDIEKAIIFDSYPSSNTSTSVTLRAYVSADAQYNYVYQWINGAETPISEVTTTEFKLWIKGIDSPSYKINWHNTAQESQENDLSQAVVHIECGTYISGSPFHYSFKEIPYTDGSVKFTWYDIDNASNNNVNLLFPWISLQVYVTYIINGEEKESGKCTVDLRQKDPTFYGMFKNIVNAEDGSTLIVVNYDDDPEGYDSDNDDYHDPSDNDDDTPDPSADIDISGVLCKTFLIDSLELKKLGQFLWSSDFFDNILLVNNSPIENIVSLKALIGSVVTSGTSQTLTLGNVASTVNVTPCKEVITIDVGSITIPHEYENFLDFEPYTKVQIYLPFYGCAMLDSSLVTGRAISIKYIIDVITATAKIKIIHENKTLYEFKTNCGTDLPITSSNRASVEMGYISSAVGMGVSVASGNVIGALASGLSMAQSQFHSTTSGNVSGVLNFHDSRMVTILVDRPVYTELLNFNKTHGRMCNLSKTLRELNGFTKCAENVQIPFNCLDEERTMLIEQLVNGVII